MRIRLVLSIALALLFALVSAPASTPRMPLSEVKPGMVGVGKTVFEGTRVDEFRVRILGVLRNAAGPQRTLILARLEGGPLANVGVIAGMSGSPVYIDRRLVGAVAYSVGSFAEGADRRHHADRRDDRCVPVSPHGGQSVLPKPRAEPPAATPCPASSAMRCPASAPSRIGPAT